MADADLKSSFVRVGVWKLKKRTGKAFKVKQFVVHKDYKFIGQNMPVNDIALIQLEGTVLFNSHVASVALPGPQDVFNTKAECWVTGWGNIGYNRQLSGEQTLQELQVPLLDTATCRSMYPTSTDDMLCAGYIEGEKDACTGDSGGPLVCKSSGKFVQVGVVSFGDRCAQYKKTGVYTRVQHYLTFINENINQYSSP